MMKYAFKSKHRHSARKYFNSTRMMWFYPLALLLIAGCAVYAYAQHLRSVPPTRSECVILLHGLLRSAASMTFIEHQLIMEGYAVINIDYASTRSTIPAVAEEELAAAIAQAKSQGHERIHIVSHSLGALVIRTYLQRHHLPEGSRIVMLAPPNQGSELADWAKKKFPRLFQMAGPAAAELGTEGETFTSKLYPITPDVGIIIGNDSWNPLFSRILPGIDDGAVSVERAKLKEMDDFVVAPCNHTSIILNKNVRHQIVHFLATGKFLKNE